MVEIALEEGILLLRKGWLKFGTLLWIGVQPKALILQVYDGHSLLVLRQTKACSHPRAFGFCVYRLPEMFFPRLVHGFMVSCRLSVIPKAGSLAPP